MVPFFYRVTSMSENGPHLDKKLDDFYTLVIKLETQFKYYLSSQTEFETKLIRINKQLARINRQLLLLKAEDYTRLLNRLEVLEAERNVKKSRWDKFGEKAWYIFSSLGIAYIVFKLGLQ